MPWDEPASTPGPKTWHIYQDTDPLGRGRWFWYVSRDGHVIAQGGDCLTENEAIAEARASAA